MSELPSTPAAESSTPRVFKVPAERLSIFQEKFAALQRRARKLGCPVPTCELGEFAGERVVEQDLDGEPFVTWVEFYPVTVAGVAPRFSGWTFLAVVDYEAEAPIFRKTPAADQYEVPERYRTMGPVCEHCRAVRGRKETFIVRHEDGRVVQVGRQCLKDFLGHDTPENVAALAAFGADVHDACSSAGEDDLAGFGLGGRAFVPAIEDYLAWVCRSIRLWGWLSKRAAHEDEWGKLATATQAAGAFEDYLKAVREGRADRAQKPTEADKARALEVLAWCRTLGDGREGKLSDYEHNLKAVATLGRVSSKHFGLVASAVSAFDREPARRRATKNEHVGTVGERLRGVRIVVDRVIQTESAYGAHIVLMRDEEGRAFKWYTSAPVSTGKEYEMTGTVKGHGEYKGTLQTVVTRAELQADDEPTKAERARAETLDYLLSDCEQTLSTRLGWENDARNNFLHRRRDAADAVHVAELEALRVELHVLAGVIQPADEEDRGDLSLVRRAVQAQLAAAAPDRTPRKLKPADKARAHMLVESIRDANQAVNPMGWVGGETAPFVTLAECAADDVQALTAIRAEMRAHVDAMVFRPRGHSDDYWLDQFTKGKAAALAALDAEVVVVAGANPAAAARLAKGLRKANAMLRYAPFQWEQHDAFAARVDSAEAACDVSTLETLRAEIVAAVPTLLPDGRPGWLTEHVESHRDAVLACVTKKPAKQAA